MKKVLIASASVLALMTSSALAADYIAPEPAGFNWTGFHIGVGGGAGYNTYDVDNEFFVPPWSPSIPEIITIDGDLGAWYGFGTVEVGADWQPDGAPFVIGVLGSYDFNGSSDAEVDSFTGEGDGDFTTADIEAELGDTWFLGARAGFAFHDTSLLYVLGGYTWAKGKVNSVIGFDTDDGDDFGEIDEDESVDGFTIGAGFEQMLTDALSIKIEYRHDFLDDIDWDEAPFDPEWGGVDFDNNMNGSADFSRDTIRGVLSWRFGL